MPRSALGLPLGLTGWRLLTGLLTPFARLVLRQRAARGKEDWARLNERLGLPGLPRPTGRLVWVHGASVGESLSALPLIEKLLEQDNNSVLVTSGTVTSAAMMGQRLAQAPCTSSCRWIRRAPWRFDHGPDAGCSWNPICGPI